MLKGWCDEPDTLHNNVCQQREDLRGNKAEVLLLGELVVELETQTDLFEHNSLSVRCVECQPEEVFVIT